MIDGINVPVSMRADERGNYRPPPSGAGAGYWCGNAGANVPSHPSLQACTWRFNPTISGDARATMLRYVTPNGRVCTSDAECTAPDLCGTSIASTGARVLRTCGRQIGWWTAHALCGATANTYGAPLECNAAVPGAAGTRANLFGCDGPYANSCYTPGATATCCGCAEWPYPSPEACRSHNPTWQSIVQPWAQFVKDACPTAYSYQFDDPTSTFKCQTTEGPNGTDYTITFCPGGLRGF